eukprot:3836106-Pyramimonas_sp.AAC.1
MEKVVARRLDHALAPTSHPFAVGEEEDVISTEDEIDIEVQAKAIRRTASSFPEGLRHDPLRPPSMTKEEVEVRNQHYQKHKQWKRGEITKEEFRQSRRIWNKVRRHYRSRQVQYKFRDGKKT